MTKRKAVIDPKTNLVVNVIRADDNFSLPGMELVTSNVAGPGDTWNGAFSFTRNPKAPLPAPPQSPLDKLVETLKTKGVISQAEIDALRP